MKYNLLLFVSLIIASFAYAQNIYKPGFFVLKGKIKNAKSFLIDYSTTSYFEGYSSSIAIKPDGSFEKQIPIQGRQNLFLSVSDDNRIYFTVADRDTLQLNWDETGFKKSFTVKGKNAERTKELQLEQKMQFEFDPETLYNLYDTLNKMTGNTNTAIGKILFKNVPERDKTLSELARYELVNDQFNRQVKMILRTADSLSFNDAQYKNLYYLITDIYFQYCAILRTFELLPKYDLKLTPDNFNVAMNTKKVVDNFDRKIPDYTSLNEFWFRNVANYRNFIFNYVNLYHSFYWWQPYPNSPEKSFNPTLDQYYSAQSAFQIINIKEWFITQLIFRNFGNNNFADVENVYKLAVSSITNTYLKDTLQKYHTAVVRLKPRSPAPGFTLKNDKDQPVSLNDFKGRVVYLDFLGVTCGPCISDIVRSIPKMHEHYKNKDVAFINICVDSKKADWKAALKKYKLEGVNLIAENFYNTPVIKSYNISGIPHYVLIDKQGKMVNNNVFNVVNPQALDLNSGVNAIDNLLK